MTQRAPVQSASLGATQIGNHPRSLLATVDEQGVLAANPTDLAQYTHRVSMQMMILSNYLFLSVIFTIFISAHPTDTAHCAFTFVELRNGRPVWRCST